MLGELDRKSMKRAGVKPLQKSLDDELRGRSSRLIWLITSGLQIFFGGGHG